MKMKSMLLGALALVCTCAFGEETKELGVKDGAPGAAARKLLTCGFLLNKDFKENAKYYLCLFSASWCGPCRREMPRIAKTYAESLKDDPNVELIHFSRDREEDKALAWAKEYDVKFPVVKYNGGNPLDLHTRGIPHLFIVDADGKLLEEGHPAKLFTNEKLNALKTGTFVKPETATEKTRKAIEKLFPGWSLDSEVPQGGRQPEHSSGFHASHRGRNNIIRLHPMNRETPVVLSRMVKLPDNNPCLALCVSSWNDDADFLLSVRVNGKDALTNRLVCTPDAVPWEDIVVPLSPWRGSSVKLEIILSANNWWCEWSHLARVDIIEADGDMRINEGKWEVDGYTWSYRAQNGEATIVAENDGRFSAVSPCPVGSITIPATIAGAKVKHIGRGAFRDCSTMTSVTIPKGVSRIGREAFRDCTGLKSIKIPSSVQIIERDAFAGCNGLASVSIPEGVTSIDRGAFYWCCGLGSIVIPSSVTHIGRDAFSFCLGLPSITIPENVTDVGPQAFRLCKALASVTIPASVTNIWDTAFCDTYALTSFQVDPGNRFYKSENGLLLTKDGTTLVRGVNGDATIPPSVTAIGNCAFEGCVALRSAEIPSGVKSIGPFAFKQCRGMKSVTIPSSVTDIGHEAFSGCKNLKSIAIPRGVTAIRNSTFSGTALTEVMIPANVKLLERGAFSWCGELKSVSFPEGMTSIGRDVFYNCGKLTSLTIPSSVQRIEQGAFHGCGSLISVTMCGERPDAPKNIFERCGKLKSIHVPAKAKSWAGMKEWLGIPLVFDRAKESNNLNSAQGVTTAQKLQGCNFLLNKDFKKNAKYYLCLFSASWCGPCRREMPRIAKTYAETLKDDPNIELIHFSCDQNDEKALAWAKEHDVKFPVVKPNGGNPLDLHTRGIPHLFIVKADGTLVEEGHPMKLFTDEKLRELKAANGSMAKATEKTGDVATKLFPGSMGTGLEKSLVGYWPFDGNANDATRYHNNGTLHGVTPAEDRHGNANKAYRFNGSSYIEVPHSETLNMTHAITMTAWVKPQSWWANQWIVVMQKGDQRNVNYQFAMRIDDKVFLCGVAQGKCEKLGLELNKWQQVALTYESGKNLCFYRNGALIGKWQCSQDLQPNKGSLLVGYDPFGWTEHFIGDMDDVRLFNQALSEEEIKALYKAEFPTAGKEIVDGIEWTYSIKDGKAQLDYASSSNETGSITIPSTLGGCPVTSIRGRQYGQPGVFENCCMTSVTIPSSVMSIGDRAFERCTNLTNVTISSSVTRIGSFAFFGCSSLVSIVIPSGVTSIGWRAFDFCSGLASVRISASVKRIEREAFNSCSNLMSFSVESDNPSYSSRNGLLCSKDGSTLVAGVNGDMSIPSCVIRIGENAFEGCDGLTSVTIPLGVTSIGERAFAFCRGLTSVTIPSSVTKIGSDVFMGTPFYRNMPDGMVVLGGGVLCGYKGKCPSTITIPSNVTSIAGESFSERFLRRSGAGLQSVVIASSVTDIGSRAFSYCGDLANVTMLGERPNAPNNIFERCGKLKAIHVPANAKSWAGMKEWLGIPLVFVGESKADGSLNGEQDVEYKFAYRLDDKGNAVLTGVSPKPEGALVCPNILEGRKVTGIDKGAFGGCDKMTKIMLPEDLDTLPLWISGWCIHGSIFYGCTALSSIGISEKNLKFASVDGALYSKDKKVLFAYPKDRTEIKVCRETTSIQGDAFHSSLLFKKINIPEGIRDTSGFALSGCPNLEEVVFPKGLEYIRHRAFWGCPNMKKVVFLGDAPVAPWRRTSWRENVFCGAARDIVVYVRKGSKGWNGKDSTDLPGRWPLDGSDSRPIRYIDEAAEKMNDAFSLDFAPGSITELDLGNVAPLQFVYCPAGKFSMGYKEQPAISKVKDIEITSPFWVSKIPIRADQLELLGLNSITNAETGDAVINDATIVVQKLPSVLKERFGKMLPPGYVFRLPTEAEFEYLQKAETKDKDAQTNIWGVERLYAGGCIGLLDRAPEYGKGVDVVNRWHNAKAWTDLVKVNYENQPDKDPVGWSDNPNWSVFRRGRARDGGGGKLITRQRNSNLYGFYFVVAPDVDKLNKFYWK